MFINEAHTGWKIVILSVYYNSNSKFISDPDLRNNPPKSMINNLMSNMKNYSRNFKIIDGKSEKMIVHIWYNPYRQCILIPIQIKLI